MKAIQLVKIKSPLQLREIPLPATGPEDVLVRIKTAGICHSDVHYRAGKSAVGALPQTLGHEVAGVVEKTGKGVVNVKAGDRVCLHYLKTCGHCRFCRRGLEQFCERGQMIGKHCDGGFAEYIALPAVNAVHLPEEVSFETGAVLMCSAATSFHALRKARLKAGERVAVFGAGGLGMSAVQLAYAMGAATVFAVDIDSEKLKLAEFYGAVPLNATAGDPVSQIIDATSGEGVDVALEVIGLPETLQQAVRSLTIFGRAALAGISEQPFCIDSYPDLLGKETQVVGCADHLLHELPLLLTFVRQRKLDLSKIVTGRVPFSAEAVNTVLDDLEQFKGRVRTVIELQ
jgi:propanol-preferring alcohol dehydrogenase